MECEEKEGRSKMEIASGRAGAESTKAGGVNGLRYPGNPSGKRWAKDEGGVRV